MWCPGSGVVLDFYQSLIFAFVLTFETTCLHDMPEHNSLKKDVNSTGPNSLVVEASASGAEVKGSIASVCDSGVYSDMAGW